MWKHVIAFSVIVVWCSNAIAQAPSSAPRLPDPDPTIQRWIQSLIAPTTPNDFVDAMRQAWAAKLNGKLREDVWLTQGLFYLSQEKGEMAFIKVRVFTDVSRSPLGIWPRLEIVAPYMDHPDDRVATLATYMINEAGVLTPSKRDDIGLFGHREFTAITPYLLSVKVPSWRLVREMYSADPVAAVNTASAVYLKRDEFRVNERSRNELTVLMLSLDLVPEAEKEPLGARILTKLREMADHPHWSVRAYALLMIKQGLDASVARVDCRWARELPIPQRLVADPNPFVSEMAKAILLEIEQTEHITPR